MPTTRDDPPPGFRYRADLLTADDEAALVSHVRAFELTPIQMRGRIARRRTTHFGWVYGYESWRITPGPPIPENLCRMRFQRGTGEARQTGAAVLEPRSAYVLHGEARWHW